MRVTIQFSGHGQNGWRDFNVTVDDVPPEELQNVVASLMGFPGLQSKFNYDEGEVRVLSPGEPTHVESVRAESPSRSRRFGRGGI